ncbi:MAG: UDP-N-acetylmuramoyl-tripeptide--D-alanyl-D-alanine ligase [Treponema sp.]|nr:UDP-N-acetylmuramoyl-tripeptide--D-alanyl-D-alanine ligase [Treponema sp.]
MNSLLSLEELVSAVNGKILGTPESCCFTSVETDSRNVVENTMFVPLVGEFQNGHKYIPQAIEKGASVVLINAGEYEANKADWEENLKKYQSVVFICVENTLHGLQDAAEAYVNKVSKNMIKISITGSCGKTTTKEMTVAVCKAYYGEDKVAYTKGNFNSETGLPLSVFKIRGDETVGIFEMGMNRVNEIGEISKVWKSQYGIITNIGTAHIGILGSRENIALEKRKSFDYIPSTGAAFVPATDDFADFCTEKVAGKVVKFGSSVSEKESGVKFVSDNGLYGTTFELDGETVNLPLSGSYNYENALGVVALAKTLGIPAVTIKKGLENSAAAAGRMEIKKISLKNSAEITLVKDCYNANPDSMLKAIDFIESLKEVGQKVVILADMRELGEKSEAAHRSIGNALIQMKPAKTILVGEDMHYCLEEMNKAGEGAEYFAANDSESFQKIAEIVNNFCKDKDVVLLKGSNSMKLADLEPLFVKKEGGAE